MKKIICSTLALLLTFSLVGCGSKKDKKESNSQDVVQGVTQWESDITALSPSQGEDVFLTNDLMTDWLKTYSYGSSAPIAVQEKDEELYYPKASITLSWEDKKDCDYYLLLLDVNEDFSAPAMYHVTEKKKSVSNLFVCTDYYWRVVGFKNGKKETVSNLFHFVTASTPRTVHIDGVSNTRDVGGYMTSYGKRVKQGLVYRTGNPESITTLGKRQATETYGIKTEIDLRGAYPHEDQTANALYEGYLANGSIFNYGNRTLTYKYFWAPWYADAGIRGLQYRDANGEYVNNQQFVKIFKEFANPDSYPILFHCAVGRDRTGTLACILNALLGVAEEDLFIDYETSFFAIVSTEDKPHVDTMLNMFKTILGYLYSFEGDTLADKTANYLMTYGMTQEEIDTIRNIMLEE